MVLLQGQNGQGKTNLLEAIYILAIAKSPRATTDREMVRWQSAQEETYSKVAALIHRDAGHMRVQLDFRGSPAWLRNGGKPGIKTGHKMTLDGFSVQKYVRVNGVTRRASELVGQVNVVMFNADDLELVNGPPAARRRYIDILISQLDQRYLRASQRYQKIVYQRNHLLKMVRDGGSPIGEMEFWNSELVKVGAYIMAQRFCTLRRLSEMACSIHKELTGNAESLELFYKPSVNATVDGGDKVLESDLIRAIEAGEQREIAQGRSLYGPHRDDIQLFIDGMDAGVYASRGQSRTAVLAMKLAEAHCLMDQRQEEPILLLDDVLSELDEDRRAHVLGWANRYQQCFITTTDANPINEWSLSRMSRFVVSQGRVRVMDVPAGHEV